MRVFLLIVGIVARFLDCATVLPLIRVLFFFSPVFWLRHDNGISCRLNSVGSSICLDISYAGGSSFMYLYKIDLIIGHTIRSCLRSFVNILTREMCSQHNHTSVCQISWYTYLFILTFRSPKTILVLLDRVVIWICSDFL